MLNGKSMTRPISLTISRSLRLVLIISLILSCDLLSHAQRKRAFLVGISDYQSTSTIKIPYSWNNIHGSNDIALLTPTLMSHGFQITSITDKEATAKNIRQQLSKFISSCKPGDIVYLHFSCHGQPVEDLDGDEADGWDEALIPIDAWKVYLKGKYQGENHIIDDELHQFLLSLRTVLGKNGHVIVAIDACHAGTTYRGEENEDSVITRGTNKGFSKRGLKFVPKIDRRGRFKVAKSSTMSDICVIEACRSYQINNEINCNGTYYGSLSYYINRVLQSRNIIWSERWYDDVISLMSKDTRLIRQNPVIETSE